MLRKEIELSAGVVEYTDTGGSGETLVLVHGLGFDESVWQAVVDDLRADFRVMVPVLPMGSHRRPMRPDADLSAQGVANLLAEFLERLDLRDVTLVQNGAGTAQLLVGVVLPGPLLVRLPNALGGMARHRIPYELVRRWYGPLLTDRRIRRAFAAFLRSTRKDTYLRAAERLRGFCGPALVAWGAEERMMPHSTGRRLAALLPRGEYVEIPDARTLVQLDNPGALCAELRRFIKESPGPRLQDPNG